MGDAHMGLQARLMSQALRKLTAIVARSKTCFIFINQIREKIGFFLGNPETTTGGRALKFYASLRVDVRRMTALKEGDQVVGNRVKVKIVKNKMAPPFRDARVRHHLRRGDLPRGRPGRYGRQRRADREVREPGTPTRASGSARAGTTSRSCSRKSPSWRPSWTRPSGPRSGWSRPTRRPRSRRSPKASSRSKAREAGKARAPRPLSLALGSIRDNLRQRPRLAAGGR